LALFKPPFKRALDWAGVIPVKRDTANGLTEQVVATIQKYDNMVKTTFHFFCFFTCAFGRHSNPDLVIFLNGCNDLLSKSIGCVFDYDHKTIHCLGHLNPSGNYDEDLTKIFERYEGKIIKRAHETRFAQFLLGFFH
jgi:hypothetical protein